MSDDESFDKLTSVSLRVTRSNQKKQAKTELSELDELERRLEARKRTEARVREEEKVKDEEQIVKKVFSADAKEEEKRLSKVLGEQERLEAEMRKADGPPPPGFFSFPLSEVPESSISPLEFKAISHEELLNGSFRASIRDDSAPTGTSIRQASIGEMNYLFQQMWLAQDDSLSTACFDSLVSLLTGDYESFFSSRATIPVPRADRVKAPLFADRWSLSTQLLETLMLNQFLVKSDIPRANARRGLRVIELLGKMNLLESAFDALLYVLSFASFSRSETLEPEIRACVNELSIKVPEDGFEKFGGFLCEKVCLGRLRVNMLRETVVSQHGKVPMDDAARDECLHRAVRLGGLMTTTERTRKLFIHFLRALNDAGLFASRSSEHAEVEEDDVTLTDGSVRALVKTMLAFLSSDVSLVHSEACREAVKPRHFHRWQATVTLVEYALFQVEPELEASTKKFVFEELSEVQTKVNQTFATSYTYLIECIRFVKRQCEPFMPYVRGPVQSKITFGTTKKRVSTEGNSD